MIRFPWPNDFNQNQFRGSPLLSLANCNYSATGSVLLGDFFRFKTNYLILFPIPKELSPEEQKPFISLVNKILSLKQTNPQADTTALEHKTDKMVYKLYDLTPEEIKIVEGK